MQHTLRWKRLLMLCLALVMMGALGALGFTAFRPARALTATLVNDEVYPWVYNEDREAYQSPNVDYFGGTTMTVHIEEAGTFEVLYLVSCYTLYDDDVPNMDMSDYFYFIHTPASGEEVKYGPFTGSDQTEFTSVELTVSAGDTISFTFYRNGWGYEGDNGVFVRLPDMPGQLSAAVTNADPELGSVTLNGESEFGQSFDFGTHLVCEAVPAEGAIFRYWTSGGEPVCWDPVYETNLYFPLQLEACFVSEDHEDALEIGKFEDGSPAFTLNEETSMWEDGLNGQPGSADMRLSFIGTRYVYVYAVVTKSGTSNSYGRINIYVDGEYADGVYWGSTVVEETFTMPVEGEGYHEVWFEYVSENGGGSGEIYVESQTEESAIRTDVQFDYDSRLGDVYLEGERVEPGQTFSLIEYMSYHFLAVPKETVDSTIVPGRTAEAVFVSYDLDGSLLSDEADCYCWFSGSELLNVEVVFQEVAVLPAEMSLTMTVDGSSQSFAVEEGMIYEVPFWSDNMLMFTFSDYAGLEEELIVLDNGEPVSVAAEGGYFGLVYSEVNTVHDIELYLEAEGYADSPVLSFRILPVSGNTLAEDLLLDGSDPVEIFTPETIVNDSGTYVRDNYQWILDTVNSTEEVVAYRSGNGGVDSSYSAIAFTVTGSGALVLEIMLDAQAGTRDYAMYRVGGPIFNTSSTGKVKIQENCDWTQLTIPIEAEEGVQTVVYLCYYKNYSTSEGQDLLAVRNVGFFTQSSTISFGTSRESYGSVSAQANGQPIESGSTQIGGQQITLTATVPEGGQFYGWKNSAGVLISTEESVTVTVALDETYTAIIEEAGYYAAKNGNEYYTTLAEALADAASGETVVLMKDLAVEGDLTVPEGVTLLVPYSEAHRATETGTSATAITRLPWYTEDSAAKYLFRTLTVNAGATLTVNGTLTVGAVCHYPDQSSQGHTSGAYGKMVNNGEIVIASGGSFYSYGLTEGEGRILAQSGAKVFQPFLVANFSGGSNTQQLYYADQFPFVQYATVNIQCELTLEYGALEIGMASLYALGGVNLQNVLVIGFEGNTDLSIGPGLILLKEGATLTKTYDGSKYVVSTTTSANINSDIGKTTVTISGGASAGSFSLNTLLGVYGSTDMVLALPYNFDLVLNDGSYDIDHAYKIMPGASLTVGEDAVLNVNAGGSLAVYDGLRQSAMSGKRYPTTEELTEYGFSPAGALIVNGTLNVDGAFAGIVQTASSGAELIFGQTAVLSMNVVDGGKGYYDSNESRFTLTARALTWDGSAAVLTDLVAGKTYAVTSAEGTGTLASYTMQYLVNCTADDPDLDPDYTNDTSYHKWSTETVTVNLTLTGVFVEAHEHTWQLGEMTAEPSATEDGEALLVCSHAGCLESRTETVPAYGAPEAEYAEGLRLSDVSLPEGWSWRNPNMSLFAGETEATAVWNGMYEAQVTVTVAKASVEKPSDPQASFTYDGTLHTVQIPENPAYTVYDNTGTDAGSYTLIIRLNNTSDYQWSDGTTANLTFDWTIRKGTFDMSGVTFADAEREYTGSELSLEVSGLPEGVSASYSYEGDRTELGQVEVTASFSFTDEALAKNYELPADMTATMTVVPAKVARPVIEGSYTYTGEPQTAQIAENSLYTVTGNTATAAGEHPVTVSLTDKTHYTWADGSTDDLTLTFTIGKANYDMSGVTFEDLTETYSGSPYTLTISGTLPEGVSVSYSANSLTNAGQLEVTASFTGDGDNYFAIPDMTATLTVSKLSHQAELEGVEDFADTEVTFDEGRTFTADSFAGMLPSLALTVTIEKDGSLVEAIHNAGVYAVTVEVADTANRTGKVSFTVTVNKAQQADFVLTASADGVSITASAPEGAVFSLNGETWQESGTFTGLNPGQSYTVYARLAGGENYEDKIMTLSVTTDDLSEAREAVAAIADAETMSEIRAAVLAADQALAELSSAERAALDLTAYDDGVARFNAMLSQALEDGADAEALTQSLTPAAGAAALGLLSLLALALRKFF